MEIFFRKIIIFCNACISVPTSLQEFVKDAGNYSKKIVDDLLDQITSGDHSKTIYQLKQVCPWCTETSQVHQNKNGHVSVIVWDALFSIVSLSRAGLAVHATMQRTKLETELISREVIFFFSPARSVLQCGSLCDCRDEEAGGRNIAGGRRDQPTEWCLDSPVTQCHDLHIWFWVILQHFC